MTKNLLRTLKTFIWKQLIYFIIQLNSCQVNSKLGTKIPKIFFAGAIAGNRGGPKVKTQRLHQKFPQKLLHFNLVYVLSNFPFLNMGGIKQLKNTKIPIVLNQNGVYSPGWYGEGYQIKNIPNKLIYLNCDYVFWQSSFARESSRAFLSTEDPKGEILYNSVDLNYFFPNSLKKSRNDFVFLVAGNFNSSNFYQIDGALTAFSKIRNKKNLSILVAGLSENLKYQVSERAAKLKINQYLQVSGKFTQKEAADLFRSVDVYLALKYMDTCPNLVIESLASGVPVIYSKTGGTKELVDHSCGIGVDVAEDWKSIPVAPNCDKLCEAMSIMVQEGKTMKLAARTKAESSFDIRHWYLRHEMVFNMLLDSKD